MFQDQHSVLILGLDGATFDLMLPWMDEGRLPNLRSLLERGAHSRLESTIPPITPCAWSGFMTGKNPGKHGLFDFVEPTNAGHASRDGHASHDGHASRNGHGFRFCNAASRHGETLWGYLSRLGRTVGVVNVPMTFPPEPVNGYLISGLDTPHVQSEFSYPAGLKQELKEQSIDYRFELQHLGNMRSDARRDHQLRDLREVEAVRTDTFKHLNRKHPADFRMLVYGATDQVSHHFWHYMDPNHDKYDAHGAKKYQHAIRDIYQYVDGLIGSILEQEDDETIVMIMSDHGFGPTSSVRLRLNQVLEAAGLLEFSPEGRAGTFKRILAGLFDRLLRGTLSPDVKRALAGRFPQLRVWFEKLDENKINWNATRAYANEAYRSSPAVWINREHEGNQDEAGTLEAIEAALKSLRDPRTGRPVISNVYRTRDLYDGPFVKNAPDLLLSWWEDGFLMEQSVAGGADDLQAERSGDPLTGGVEFAGSHRLDGVFMMAGGPVRNGFEFSGAEIIDVAPTALHLMGLPIPNDMDGRPLLEALNPDYVATHAPQFAEGAEPQPDDDTKTDQHSFTDEETELIRERLQALGYVE